jgi:transposase
MIAPEHPARVVDAVVDSLDISELERGYKGGGASSYEPRAMLKIIVYSYLTNVYSGRQMAKLWNENIVYMWLGGTVIPDFRTINNFRSKRLVGTFDSLFTQVVELLHDEGLVSLKVQYIDGTKIESVANKYSFVWKRATETNKAKLEKNVRAVLEEAERTLEMEQREAESEQAMTAQEMEERTGRILERMKEKKDALTKQQRKAVEKVADESVTKMREYEQKLETLGERNSYSKTDPDATFMRMKEDAMNNGQTKPGYNIQIATENQYITNYGTFWRPNDQGTFIPFMTSFSDRYGIQSEKAVADSGYGSEQNYAWMEENGIEAFVKYNMFHSEDKRKYRNDPFLVQNLYYNSKEDYYVCPMGQHMEHIGDVRSTSDLGYVSTISKYRAQNCVGCPLRGLCYKGKTDRRVIEVNHKNNEYRRQAKERLTSEEGLYHRSMRPIEPEAVFGDIKYDHGFKRFRLKGYAKVNVEFGLVALAHNLRKYARVQTLEHPVTSEPAVAELPKTDEKMAA